MINMFKKAKDILLGVCSFRRVIRNELAHILLDMSNYKTLDEVKVVLIQAGLTAAISQIPVVGGLATGLTEKQLRIVSEEIVRAGHKAEKLLSDKLK